MITKSDNKVETNQELFFDQHSQQERVSDPDSIFYKYAIKEQVQGLKWVSNSKKILDYGCGPGTSIDMFFKHIKKDKKNYRFYGVDISTIAISKAKINYPKFKFYKISDNKMPQISNNLLDAAFIFHVLHHSKDHADIFKEIHSKLKKGGKFLIIDLSSNNIFLKIGRMFFILLSPFIKNKFEDDLVVDGKIPEKYKVNIAEVKSLLEKTGFSIEDVGHGHLFFFLFAWLDKFIKISNFPIIKWIYKYLMNLEKNLLKFKLFQNNAEVFYIKSVKK